MPTPFVPTWGVVGKTFRYAKKVIAMSDFQKCAAVILPYTLVLAFVMWSIGNNFVALSILAFIPLTFGCGGLSFFFAGSERREIARHLTYMERIQLVELARIYIERFWSLFAGPVLLLAGVSYFLFAQSLLVAAIVYVVGMLIGLPVAFRMARPIRDFYFTTAYAKNI